MTFSLMKGQVPLYTEYVTREGEAIHRRVYCCLQSCLYRCRFITSVELNNLQILK